MSETSPPTPASDPPTPQATPPSQTTTSEQQSTPTPEPSPEPSLLNKGEEQTKPEAKGAPEKYEPFTAPKDWEDKGWELNTELLEKDAYPLFKELGLSQEQAQKLVDFYGKISLGDREASMNAVKEQRDAWLAEVAADPELKDFDRVRASVGKMWNALGTTAERQGVIKEFRDQMDITGLGNMPSFVKIMNWVSQAFTEGTSATGGKPSPLGQRAPGSAPKSAAEAMYPNLAKG